MLLWYTLCFVAVFCLFMLVVFYFVCVCRLFAASLVVVGVCVLVVCFILVFRVYFL